MDYEQRVVALQVSIVMQLMKKYKLTEKQFVALDLKYGILEYLRIGYEPFHLTGDLGIIEEVEQYVSEQGGVFL